MIASDKRILRVGAVAVVLLIAFFVTYGILSMDAAPPQDSRPAAGAAGGARGPERFLPSDEADEKVRLPEEQRLDG